jgi:hypothetical protein
MKHDLEILIPAWRLNCEYLQKHVYVNNAVEYVTVVHKDPCRFIDYTCDVFFRNLSKSEVCIIQSFFNHFLELHTNVKAILNHTTYILIWYLCVKI